MRLLLPNHPALLQGRQVLLILQLWLRLLPPVPLLMPLPPLELLVPPQEIPVLRLGQVVLRLLLPVVSLLRQGLLVLLLEMLIRRSTGCCCYYCFQWQSGCRYMASWCNYCCFRSPC